MEAESQQSSLQYLNLIDGIDGTVVQANPGEHYLAISYVWGHSASGSDQQPGGEARTCQGPFSFAELRLTIQDAIWVVRKLGMRYLWVVKYCIMQEACAEKILTIRNMGQIYENGQATIVALDGQNDEAGPPGVSRISRTPQPRFPMRTGTGCLLPSFPPIRNIIANSQWNARGCTFQEVRLSRRCFFFTQYQVYFVYRESTRSEAVPSDSKSRWISSLLNSIKLDANLLGRDDSVPEGLVRDRLMFSQRRLTYERDVLDAFRGILARSAFITFWGVSVIPTGSQMDPCLGLALGLLWMRRPVIRNDRHEIGSIYSGYL
jgi:Heterokaryon incompatibility protein (HET)